LLLLSLILISTDYVLTEKGTSGVSVVFSCIFKLHSWSCNEFKKSPYLMIFVGCSLLGLYMTLKWICQERAKAIEKYRVQIRDYRFEALEGDTESQYLLAGMFKFGFGVKKNHEEALKWLKIAGNQGHPDAQFALGDMYHKGQGTPKDYVLAYMWLTLAIFNGEIIAIEYKNIIEKKMSRMQIEKAEEMVSNWAPKSWKELSECIP